MIQYMPKNRFLALIKSLGFKLDKDYPVAEDTDTCYKLVLDGGTIGCGTWMAGPRENKFRYSFTVEHGNGNETYISMGLCQTKRDVIQIVNLLRDMIEDGRGY